jgi:hypothetical protein
MYNAGHSSISFCTENSGKVNCACSSGTPKPAEFDVRSGATLISQLLPLSMTSATTFGLIRETKVFEVFMQTLATEDTEDDSSHSGVLVKKTRNSLKSRPFQHVRRLLDSPHNKAPLYGGSAVLDVFGKASLESYSMQSPLEARILGTK